MSITKRKPDSVGTILREEFMFPLCITEEQMIDALQINQELIRVLDDALSPLTSEMSSFLASFFKTTKEFWLNIQKDNGEWNAANKEE
jgi:addiction module HigA family antidote